MTRKMSRKMSAALVVVALVAVCIVGVTLAKSGAARSSARKAASTPVANFTATPTTGVAPLNVQFTDISSGSPTLWSWDFGDGYTATGKSPAHVFKAAGQYSVSLSITTPLGTKRVTKTNDITVSAPAPQSGWTTIIDDQFNTPGLPAHWKPYSGSYQGDAASCTSPSQAQVPGDGYLHLKMEYRTSGVCGHDWYTAGMQIDKQYGGVDQAITLRWRIVPSKDPNIVRSTYIIPMRWVQDPKFQWYQGEADYCEGSGLYDCFIYLHYGPNYQQNYHDFTVDLTQWHTFRIESRDHTVSVFIDDLTTPAWVYHGDDTTVPAAFMRTVLQQSCALSVGCPPASYAGDVEDIQIDWITIQNAVPPTANTQADTHLAAPTQETLVCASGTGHSHALAVTGAPSATPKTVMCLGSYTAPVTEPRRRLLAVSI